MAYVDELRKRTKVGKEMSDKFYNVFRTRIYSIGRCHHFTTETLAKNIRDVAEKIVMKAAEAGLGHVDFEVVCRHSNSTVPVSFTFSPERAEAKIIVEDFVKNDFGYDEWAWGITDDYTYSFQRYYTILVAGHLREQGLEISFPGEKSVLRVSWMSKQSLEDVAAAAKMPGGIEAIRIGVPVEDILA